MRERGVGERERERKRERERGRGGGRECVYTAIRLLSREII